MQFKGDTMQLSPEGEMNSGGYIPRREASRYIYPPLFTDPEGDSCFSIYQIRWIKKHFFNFFFWNFRETTRYISLHSQNSEYPRIFEVTGANQNAWKLLSTDLVNTKQNYLCNNKYLVYSILIPVINEQTSKAYSGSMCSFAADDSGLTPKIKRDCSA